MRHAVLCPPHGALARLLAVTLSVLVVWGVLWGLTGDWAEPGGTFFGLIVLVVVGVLLGKLVELVRLPSLLGK